MIRLLKCKDVLENWQTLKKLLIYCRESSANCVYPDSYYEDKLNGLLKYLEENKAYFFVAHDNDSIVGFLWACEIERDVGRVFHVLYFAVLEMYQGKGYGKGL